MMFDIEELVREEVDYCLNCKIKPCSQKCCTLGNNIPQMIQLVKEEQLKNIYLKLQNEEELTDEEKEIIDFYRDEQNYYQLSTEGQELCKEIIEICDSLEKEKNPELTNQNVKKLGEWPKPNRTDENAFAYIGIVTFLSGLITGMVVYEFFKLFVR